MGKPYSEDLRRNVVEAIESGHTYEDAADLWGVSVSSVSRFLTRWRRTNSISPEKFGGYKGYALERHRNRITRWLAARPDITFRLGRRRTWLSAKLRSSASFAIWASLLKKACTRPNKTGRTSARKAWLKMQAKLDPRKLVFIDESAASTNI